MLLEADAKAIQRAFRPHLLAAFQGVKAPGQFGGLPGNQLSLPSFLVRGHLLFLQARNLSGGVLFVDCKSAYYSVVREYILFEDQSDSQEVAARSLAARLFTASEAKEHFVRTVMQSDILTAHGASVELRQYVAAQFRRTWFVTERKGSEAWLTSSGTAPGSPIADVLFGLVFASFLVDLQHSLMRAGVVAKVEQAAGKECPVPPCAPTWADDVAILFVAQDAAGLCGTLATVARTADDGIQRLGLALNYGSGKTEAILAFRGSGARTARKAALGGDPPTVPFVTAAGQSKAVRIVAAYQHLGSMLAADSHAMPDIKRRSLLAYQTFHVLRKRVLNNPYLHEQEKLGLLRDRVFSRYLHGSGLWRLRTVHEQQAALEPLSTLIRGSLRVLTGISSRELCTEKVASILSVPLPEEILHVERARTLCEVAHLPFGAAWEGYLSDHVWLPQAVESLAKIATQLRQPLPPWGAGQCSLERLLAFIQANFPRLGNRGSCYLRQRVESRAAEGLALRRSLSELQCLTAPPARPSSCQGVDDGFLCGVCCMSFPCKRTLAVHQARKHGKRALASQLAYGTRCQVCGLELWSETRMKDHLRRSPHCIQVYEASDIVPERYVPSTEGSHAFRPAVVTPGPQPWWATMFLV